MPETMGQVQSLPKHHPKPEHSIKYPFIFFSLRGPKIYSKGNNLQVREGTVHYQATALGESGSSF